MNRTFSQIIEDEEREIEYNELDDPLLRSIIDEAFAAVEADRQWHEQLDDNRQWFDEKVFNKVKDTGGQLIFSHLDVLTQGFRHPDGTPKGKQGTDPEKLFICDATVRELLSLSRINEEWIRHSKDVATDGKVIIGVSLDDEGLPFANFIDPKKLHFEAGAEGIHIKDKSRRANWSFWFEEGEIQKLRAKYEDIFPDTVDQINEGTPLHRDDEGEEEFQETEEDRDGKEKRKLATILHCICLSSPVSGKFGNVEIKKGDPFEIKIVGEKKAVLSVSTGDDFVHRWGHTGEPYHPYVDFDYSYIRKGMQSISYIQKVRPYIDEIIYLRKAGKRNIKEVGEAMRVINITGEGSKSIRNEILANIRRDIQGKSKTHIKPVASNNLKIDVQSTAPQLLDQGAIDSRVEMLIREVDKIVRVMTDGTVFNAQERVGVRQFREQAQNGAVGLFQMNNLDAFATLNRMFLNVFLTISPKYFGEAKKIELDTGIVDEDGEKVVENITLDKAREILDTECLYYNWNFAPILPNGGISAMAEQDVIEDLERANQLFPQNPEIQNALLSQYAKRIQSVSGTDSFNPQKALQYEQQKMSGGNDVGVYDDTQNNGIDQEEELVDDMTDEDEKGLIDDKKNSFLTKNLV